MVGTIKRPIEKIRPRAFLDQQRRERRIHPPECQPHLFLERCPLSRLSFRPVKPQRDRTDPAHRRQQHRKAHTENNPDVQWVLHTHIILPLPWGDPSSVAIGLLPLSIWEILRRVEGWGEGEEAGRLAERAGIALDTRRS